MSELINVGGPVNRPTTIKGWSDHLWRRSERTLQASSVAGFKVFYAEHSIRLMIKHILEKHCE